MIRTIRINLVKNCFLFLGLTLLPGLFESSNQALAKYKALAKYQMYKIRPNENLSVFRVTGLKF